MFKKVYKVLGESMEYGENSNPVIVQYAEFDTLEEAQEFLKTTESMTERLGFITEAMRLVL